MFESEFQIGNSGSKLGDIPYRRAPTPCKASASKSGSSGFLVGGTGRGAASWVTGGRSVDRSSASRARLTLVLETRVPSCYPLSLV